MCNKINIESRYGAIYFNCILIGFKEFMSRYSYREFNVAIYVKFNGNG